MDRVEKFDIARGIGIIAVVYGHTCIPNLAYNIIYLFHMPLFFIISGYLYNQEDTIGKTIRKKIQSLMIPYVFFMVLCLSIFVVLYKILGKEYFISWGILIHPWGVVLALWYFISLFTISVLFKIIDSKINNDFIKLLIALGFFIVGRALFYFHSNNLFYIGSSLTAYIFYEFGYIYRKYSNYKKIIIVLGLVIIIFTSILEHFPIIDLKTNVFTNPLGIFVSTAICFLIIDASGYIEKIKWLKNLFSYIGNKSLVIFPLHILIFEFLYLIFPRNNYIFAIIISILSIAIILLLNKVTKLDYLFMIKIKK